MTDKIRPSPTQSATLYKIGTIKTGNDGNKWILLENASQNNELTTTNYINDIYTKQFNKTII